MGFLQKEIQQLAYEVLATTNDPMILLDKDKQVLFLNEAASSRLLLTVEDKMTDFLNEYIDEEKEMWIEMFNEDSFNLHNAEIFLKINNERMIFKLNILKVSVGDLLIHFHDITEKWLFERRTTKHLDLLNQFVLITKTDLEGKIIEASDAFCEASGYSQDELIGQSHNIVKHPDSDHAVFEDMRNSLKQNKTWKGVIKNKRKDGSHFWVSIITKPLFNYTGQKYGYISIQHEVTTLCDK